MFTLFSQSLPRRQSRTAKRPARRQAGPSFELLERRELLSVFTPGNLIVLRAGDTTTGYNGTAPLFLDEYNVSTGAVVQTAAIPGGLKVGGQGNQPITIDLSAAAGNGQLNRSYDGSVVTFAGLDANPDDPGATGAADRVIAIAGNDPRLANFLDTTTHGQFYVGDDNRGAVAETANGPLWAVGHPNQAGGAVSQGVHYFPTPGPSIGTQVSNQANIRGVTIGFDNRLYYSTAGSTSAGLAGIYTEAQPLPTAATPGTDVPVVKALFAASKLGGIYLADVNGTGVLSNGDRLYFLDDGTVGGAGTGGLYVSAYNTAYPGNHWSTAVRLADGIIAGQPFPQDTAQLRGLDGTVVSATETDLYATEFDNVAGNNSYVLKFADRGTAVNIASAGEAGNVVTITTALPHHFATGQTVVVDGIDTGLGGTTIVTDGYNGSWTITVVDATHFTYRDTNPHGTNLATVANQGAADVALTPTTVATLADGSVTIGSKSYAARGLRGLAFAPVSPTVVSLTANGATHTTVPPGTPVTFVATLSNPQVTPTGVITFIDQNTNTVLGQAPITSMNGVTSATFTATLVGSHRVTAYFPGGGLAALPSATSAPVKVKEAGNATSLTELTAGLSAIATGLPITLTATVTAPGSTPTGTVSFYNGTVSLGNLLGTAPLDKNGTAAFTTSFATSAKQHLIAVYNGDDTYANSHDATNVTTAPNATATITSSANYVPVGATPTYTVTLNGNAALGTPDGTVQFFLDGTALGSPQPLTPGNNNTAAASATSRALTAGSHFVTVAYTAARPYASFTVNTTTAANGVAFIETARQAFTPGDLVAVQRGDGSVNLGSSGYLVFLDEYTPAGVLVQQIALPNTDDAGGNAHALLLSGQSGAEGLLNRSANGYYLTLAGYDVPVGQQFVTSTFPFQFPRTIARIDGLADVDTSTAIVTTPGSSVPYNPQDVVSYDGNEFWLVSNLPTGDGMESGIEYIDGLGETNAIQVGPAGSTGDSVTIAGGQLYAASTNRVGGTPVGVWQVGTGRPTTATDLATLPGLMAAYQAQFPNHQDPKQLLFFNHNDGTSNNPDTLFIADQTNGLLKFWFDGTNWVFGNGAGRFGQKLLFAGGITGVAGYVVNPGPNAHFQLYVTGSPVQGQNPNQIAAFADTNPFNGGFASGNFGTLVYVGQVAGSPNGNENFAGLAFAPGYQTATVLSASVRRVMAGDPVTLTATVTATTGTPTGAVTFYDSGTVLGTALLNADGVATLTLTTLAAGRHHIIAFYNGDVKNGTSTSNVAKVKVKGPGPEASGGGETLDVAFDATVNPTTAPAAPASSTATDNQPNPWLNEQAAAPVAAAAKQDRFWVLLGARMRHGVALWSLDSDDEGSING